MPRLLPCFCLLGALSLGAPASAQCLPPAPAAQGVIFVADGSGDLSATSKNLETLLCEANLALRVERLEWSHGWHRPVSDLVKHSRHRSNGDQLAASVLAHRQTHPDDRIILVGHSAGAAIVLAAADCLPAGSVERIILLAPAVSGSYDLRPALRCAREGVDSFYSKHDPILSVFVTLLGTADRRWEASAGWLGFDAPADCFGEESLSCKLRQYGWSKDLSHTGYWGGHYSCRNVAHLRERVLPLLMTSTCPAPCPAANAATLASVWPEEAPQLVLVSPADEAPQKDAVRQVEWSGPFVSPRLGILAVPKKND